MLKTNENSAPLCSERCYLVYLSICWMTLP